MVGRTELIEDCLRALSFEKFGEGLPFATFMAWNVRHVQGLLMGEDGPLDDILRAVRPSIVVLTEVSRSALDRRHGEPVPGQPYRFLTLSTGNDQRIMIGYDTERVRLKQRVSQLEGDFTRRPLYGHFALLYPDRPEPIDIQLVAVHLKSQRGDHEMQRLAEVDALGDWISNKARMVDADLIVMGDLNGPSYDDDLERFRMFEEEGRVAFERLNRDNEIAALLHQVRKRPKSSNIEGACFLDLNFAIRAPLGKPRGVPSTEPLDRILTDVLATRANGAYLDWLKSTTSANADLIPSLFAFYFQEFEPRYTTRRSDV